jgi:dihydrofolate reductase
MKRFIYMAQSANGFIARADNGTPWSEEEWGCFNQKVKESGNLVIGLKTYELMQEQIGFDDFKKIQVVVVSSKGFYKDGANVTFVRTPREAIKFLESKNFQEIFIGGGARLNSSFFKERLVDEIYVDIEPKVFAKGIEFFTNDIPDSDLELLYVKQTGKNSVQLHYKVLL